MDAIKIPDHWIAAHVDSEEFEQLSVNTVSCLLTLHSGYTVSASHHFKDARHYSYAVGCAKAREAALQKLWRAKPYPDADSKKPLQSKLD